MDNKCKIVEIFWVDSVKCSDWSYVSDLNFQVLDNMTIGYLIKETDEFVTVAQNMGRGFTPQVCNTMTIPRCAIKGIKVVGEMSKNYSDE